MPFRIGSLKTLNYESRLDNMTDEGHLRPFYDTSKIRNTPFEAVRTIRVTPQNGDPVINHNLDSQGSLVLNRGEYILETVVVNDAVFNVQFSMWGAGGAGGSEVGGIGGGAGYTAGGLRLLAAAQYYICVGGGGDPRSSGSVTSGGECGGALGGLQGSYYGGCGGGFTGIFRNSAVQSNALLIAAGGGGAGADQRGGAGGGVNGQIGQLFDQRGGGGGSQTEGGFAGYTDAVIGDSLAGGRGGALLVYPGGGGGGGYYGGGGGGSGVSNGHGGGGGAGYIDQTRIIAGSSATGNNETPANNADADRGLAGVGGAQNSPGTDGKFIIT